MMMMMVWTTKMMRMMMMSVMGWQCIKSGQAPNSKVVIYNVNEWRPANKKRNCEKEGKGREKGTNCFT